MTDAPIIYVDLDGVLADYVGDYRRLTGGDPKEKGKIRYARFKDHPHFYRNLPLLPDAMRLWTFLKPYHPNILSAASNFLPASKQDKHEWVAEHLHLSGPKVIVVDHPEHKQRYCTPGAILIDDNEKNCQQWEKAGGIAIHHTSAETSIRALQALLNHHHITTTTNLAHTFVELTQPPTCAHLVETFEQFQHTETPLTETDTATPRSTP